MANHEGLERVLAADFLADLPAWDTGRVRRERQACEREEAAVSYARRVLQGRLDLLRAELERRTLGGDVLAPVLEDLPVLLAADHTPSDPLKARAMSVAVPPSAEALEAEIDAIIDRSGLADLASHDPDQLAELIDRLAAHEHQLSQVRRRLFIHIDVLRDELVARYKDGRAAVGDLLGDR